MQCVTCAVKLVINHIVTLNVLVGPSLINAIAFIHLARHDVVIVVLVVHYSCCCHDTESPSDSDFSQPSGAICHPEMCQNWS